LSRFILSPLARRDLDETWEHIAADNIDAADRWVSEIEKAIHLLAENRHGPVRIRSVFQFEFVAPFPPFQSPQGVAPSAYPSQVP